MVLGACASKPYQGAELSTAAFLSRSQTQQVGSLKVTAAKTIYTVHSPSDGLFKGKQVPPPSDRLHIKNERDLTVATAVPNAEEVKEIFGTNLYRKNVQPVWIGQISRDIGVHFAARTITTHKIDPNVDETKEFQLEHLAYAEALTKISYVGGTGPAPYSQPRGNLTGDPYFTDGQRIILWISSQPTAIGEIEVLDLSAYHTTVSDD